MIIPKTSGQLSSGQPPSPIHTPKTLTSSQPQYNHFEALTLNDLLEKPLNNVEQLNELLSYLRSLKVPYAALYPLKRVKGCLMKVHRLKLSSYQRYIYINPIEGVLVSYYGPNKFPISPNYILKLNEI